MAGFLPKFQIKNITPALFLSSLFRKSKIDIISIGLTFRNRIIGTEMQVAHTITIGLVAFFHIWFFILERFIWNMPLGQKIFKLTEEQAQNGSVLAANQGVYNLLLAFGLIWSLIVSDTQKAAPIQYFILLFIIGVGSYGAATVGKNILFMQVIPAVIALFILFANSANPRINDISTNLDTPPVLVVPESSEEVQITAETKEIHVKYYSHIKPLSLPTHNSQESFALAVEAVNSFPNLKIEKSDSTALRIVGTETTQFFRFVDDFVIEIKASGNGSEIHMRSKSRKGQSDFGINAERITKIFNRILSKI